jgi:hypothetical protein
MTLGKKGIVFKKYSLYTLSEKDMGFQHSFSGFLKFGDPI